MKAKKIALAVLLSVLMVVSFVLVACDKNEATTIDLKTATQWSNDRDESVYDVSNDASGNLVMSYDKTGTWQYVKRTLIEEPTDLAKTKTLVFTAAMSEGSHLITLKFEGGEEPVPEVTFQINATSKTYEWDVSDKAVDARARILLFIDGEFVTGTGTLTVSEFYLTSNAINETNKIVPYVAPQADPTEIVWNEITATKTSVTEWTADANGVYTVTKDGTSVKVAVDKDTWNGDDAWTGLIAYINGDALKTMKSFKLTVNGTAGKTAMIKPFDSTLEYIVTFTGEDQEIAIDISTLASRADADYSKKDTPTADNRVAILALNGATSGKMDLTIKTAQFSTEEVEPLAPTHEVNEITATSKAANKGWYDGGDGVYTVTKNSDGSYKIAFDKKGLEYPSVKAFVKGSEIANMTSIKLTVNGTEGTKLIFKPFDQPVPIETNVTLNGGDKTITVDISSYVTGKTFDTEAPIVIMAEGGNTTDKGEFTIKNLEFSTDAAPVDPNLNEITAENHKITKGWAPLDEGTYTVTAQEQGFKVQFNKTGTYNFLRTYVKGSKIMDFDTLRFTVKGEAGKEILFKFLDKEKRFKLTGGNDVIDLGYAEKLANKNLEQNLEVLICANSQDDQPKTGEFSLISAEFVETYNEINDQNKKVTGGWRPLDKDKDTYTVTEAAQGQGFDITYKKTDTYQFLFTNVKGAEIANMNKVVFKVKGTAGKEILLKFAGKEERFNLTGGEDTIELDFSANKSGQDFTAIQQLLVVIDSKTEGPATGSFSIIDVEFTA